jgi:hypothetical protein
VKHWEIIADNLSKAGWSWGCVSTINPIAKPSLLQMPTETTEGVSLCTRMKS